MQGNYQQFYHSQNIDLRKQIRELDFRLAQGDSSVSQCNFLVVGPPKVGKTSLLKTMQFALNGSQGWGLTFKGSISTLQIKKGARWQVEGVKELRQMSQKFGIQGIELHSQEKVSSRYKRALDFVEGGYGNCMIQPSQFDLKTKAKVCLIIVNSALQVSAQEMTYLKFLRADLFERGVKIFLILVGNFDRHSENWKKIDSRINSLHLQLQIRRDDIICMDTYYFQSNSGTNGKIVLKQSQMTSSKIENNEQINFYALQLILKIVRQSQRNTKNRTVRGKAWLCNWK